MEEIRGYVLINASDKFGMVGWELADKKKETPHIHFGQLLSFVW